MLLICFSRLMFFDLRVVSIDVDVHLDSARRLLQKKIDKKIVRIESFAFDISVTNLDAKIIFFNYFSNVHRYKGIKLLN